jgi:hypothetical protein
MYIRHRVGLYFDWYSRRPSLFPVRIAGARKFALVSWFEPISG